MLNIVAEHVVLVIELNTNTFANVSEQANLLVDAVQARHTLELRKFVAESALCNLFNFIVNIIGSQTEAMSYWDSVKSLREDGCGEEF
jgi:hypothetical protein